jgi:uncharacterized protein YkwD
MLRALALSIALALLLAGCASTRMPAALPASPPPIASQLSDLQTGLFVHVAQWRQENVKGAKPLALDPELTRAAQKHCDAMAKNNAFDPGNPDGNIAINTLMENPDFGGFVGENVAAQHFEPAYGFQPDATAQRFLEIWLMSPQHETNMAFASFDRVGIGAAVTGNTIYVSLVFASDLGLKPKPQPTPQPQ